MQLPSELSMWILERIRQLNRLLETQQSYSAEPESYFDVMLQFLRDHGFRAVHGTLDRLPRPIEKKIGDLGDVVLSWPVAVQDHALGSIQVTPEDWLLEHGEDSVQTVLEFLVETADSILYASIRAQWKHDLILEVRRDFLAPVLEDGIRLALNRLKDHVPMHRVLVLYRDYSLLSGGSNWAHLQYRDSLLEYSTAAPSPKLYDWQSYAQERSLLEVDAARLIDCEDGEQVLDLSLSGSEGRLLVSLQAQSINAFSHDMLEILAVGLEEILDGHRRDKLELLRHFSDPKCERLLRTLPYDAQILKPRLVQAGMLYADLDGFTTLSEQIFKEPSHISRLVEIWARKMIEILYHHDGVYDKLVGDCVIGLFGPPWYEEPRREILAQLVACAQDMLDATRGLPRKHPWIHDMLSQGGVQGLDVAIGLNFGPAFVGRMGADRSFTALSSAMNKAARLQGLAEGGEVIIPAWFVDEMDLPLHGFECEPVSEAALKGVSQPVHYYRLLRPQAEPANG